MKIVSLVVLIAMILSVSSIGNAADEMKRTAVLASVDGSVEMKPSSEKAVWVAGAANTSLAAGDSVKTGKDAHAIVRIDGGAGDIIAELKSQSQLTILEMTANAATKKTTTLLSLDIGEATFKTNKTIDGSKLEVKTPTSIVASEGDTSSFSVQVEKVE